MRWDMMGYLNKGQREMGKLQDCIDVEVDQVDMCGIHDVEYTE